MEPIGNVPSASHSERTNTSPPMTKSCLAFSAPVPFLRELLREGCVASAPSRCSEHPRHSAESFSRVYVLLGPHLPRHRDFAQVEPQRIGQQVVERVVAHQRLEKPRRETVGAEPQGEGVVVTPSSGRLTVDNRQR
jgi:hypothetical protein